MDLYVIELLSDCYVIVDVETAEKIKKQAKIAAMKDETIIIEGVDHKGYDFWFRSDSIVVVGNDQDSIKNILSA